MGGVRDPVTGQWTGLASLETVPVGNAGNSVDGTGFGSVGRDCRIGMYEVTAAQYCEFLNKVAGIDTYGLYNTSMWSSSSGHKIERFAGSGTTGSRYQYRVATDRANRPVNYVSFWDACRFANRLHNEQPTGGQDSSTTEDGAYTLTPQGITDRAVNRNANWKWAVTGEDEWCKAAYHKNDGMADKSRCPGVGVWGVLYRRCKSIGLGHLKKDLAIPYTKMYDVEVMPYCRSRRRQKDREGELVMTAKAMRTVLAAAEPDPIGGVVLAVSGPVPFAAANFNGTSSSSVVGDFIGFSFVTPPFGPGVLLPGLTSALFVVQTNAPAFKPGIANVIDGAVAGNIATFAPGATQCLTERQPEPESQVVTVRCGKPV